MISFFYGIIGGLAAFAFTQDIYIAAISFFAGILPDAVSYVLKCSGSFKAGDNAADDKTYNLLHKSYLSYIIPSVLLPLCVWSGNSEYAFIPFAWLLHIILESIMRRADTGRYHWWAYGVQGLVLLALAYYFYNSPFIAVVFFILLAAVVDFQKDVEVYRVGWKNINPKYQHEKPYRWHIKITAIWIVPILVFSFWDLRFLYGLVLFWLEDLFYYLQRLINYKSFLPETLNHLVADKFLLRRRWFIAIMSIQLISFLLILLFTE